MFLVIILASEKNQELRVYGFKRYLKIREFLFQTVEIWNPKNAKILEPFSLDFQKFMDA